MSYECRVYLELLNTLLNTACPPWTGQLPWLHTGRLAAPTASNISTMSNALLLQPLPAGEMRLPRAWMSERETSRENRQGLAMRLALSWSLGRLALVLVKRARLHVARPRLSGGHALETGGSITADCNPM